MPTSPLELRESFVWLKILAYAVSAIRFRGHCRVHNLGRTYTICLSSLWIWGPRCEQEHLVCVSSSLVDFYERSIHRFWFFAARKDPEIAPLITWFNGGVSGADLL